MFAERWKFANPRLFPDRSATGRAARALLLILVAAVLACGAAAAQDTPPDYRLDKGDTLKVFVLGEPDLSIELTVDDDGSVFYPLLGELSVGGMTANEVMQMLTRRLSGDYLVAPRISVRVTGYGKIYLEGEVQNPGAYPFVPGLTVRQAIALAGGFTDLASRRKIYRITETDSEGQRRKVTLSDTIAPGDILIVDESFF
jgi:polysaccharide export outer membrane protein